MRWLVVLAAAALLAAGGAYLLAGRAQGPAIEILRPQSLAGARSELELSVTTPGGVLSGLVVTLDQGGRQSPLFSLDVPIDATIQQEGADGIRVTRPFGKDTHPELTAGSARLIVTAQRPVYFGLRHVETTVERALELRFEPPRLSVLSTHHFINHGGSEMIVYRVTPPDAASGVRVGELVYPGYPASGAGVPGADPAVRVAFFALLPDQDLETAMELYAEDAAGNTGRAAFDHRVFPRPFRRRRIEIDDRFISRVVPDILARSPEAGLTWDGGSDDALSAFLEVNGRLRESNGDVIAKLSAASAPEMLWEDPFEQLGNSQVESSFADHRTYFYQGEEVDRQVHLGFDLAVTAAVPIQAANRGVVVYADYLGIYGNCVILDHGMGLQSLYGHLSSLDVSAGDRVDKGQTLGRSGMTGLAGGDHLHFTTLLQGHAVNPVDWWDPHWIDDRIRRKLEDLPPS